MLSSGGNEDFSSLGFVTRSLEAYKRDLIARDGEFKKLLEEHGTVIENVNKLYEKPYVRFLGLVRKIRDSALRIRR